MAAEARSLAVIGAGPSGIGLLERLSANAAEFPGDLVVHLIDPYPAGPGRVCPRSRRAKT
ncbi:FAD/NAD(P)-binding protein [Actinokineospora iranica]|uniref:FAD-NAD(P)-binding n=1 Tax=Actinokineospora iranica TaxID=1271860 RepID=A0A1G6LH39_9PSEU|nr:FAD/NAD(P)-binding protein [Actinokineospora iranica]SDC42524.1 FAD-NAD(P)-binding [Actinokineospora iranica]